MIDGKEFTRQLEAKREHEAKIEEAKRIKKAERLLARAIRGRMSHIGVLSENERHRYAELEFKSGFVLQTRYRLAETIKKIAIESNWRIYELSEETRERLGVKKKRYTATLFLYPLDK